MIASDHTALIQSVYRYEPSDFLDILPVQAVALQREYHHPAPSLVHQPEKMTPQIREKGSTGCGQQQILAKIRRGEREL